MKKRVLVTGASGHIGFHVALQLLEAGCDVTLLIRKKNRNTGLLEQKGAGLIIADLQQPHTYSGAMKGIDALFHIAAENTTDTSDEQRVISNTFTLCKNVLDAAVAGGVPAIIYTSSVVVLGRSSDPKVLINESYKVIAPESPYVKGKLMAEDYCEQLIREQNVDIRRLYPSWVIGSGDPKLTPPHKVIRDYLKKGQAFYFAGGISVAGVESVAKAHVNAWLKGSVKGQYILAGTNVTFNEFYTTLAHHSGHKAPWLRIPKGLIYSGSLVAKALSGKKSPVDPNYVKTVIGNYSWYTSAKAQQELDYSIPPLDEIVAGAVIDIKRKALGTDALYRKHKPGLQKTGYAVDDLLLITGVPGWLGNRMLDILMNGDRFGHNAVNRRIRVLVQPQYKGLIMFPDGIEIVYGDVTDPKSLENALQGVKAVYHLAGVIYPEKISTLYSVNEQGTKNLVDAAIAMGVRRILFMGTDSICGYGREKRIFDEHTAPQPYKNYGRSKYLAEKYILDKTAEGKIDGTSLRGFWFFGPFIPERNLRFFNMFYWKRQIVFGNGKNLRSISHVDNIIQAFVKAEKQPATIGRTYWIGDAKADYTVDELYREIAAGLKVSYKPLYIPNFMCGLFSILDSLISGTGRLNATLHAAGKFHKDIAGEITAAERDFGYAPDVHLEEIKNELNDLMY